MISGMWYVMEGERLLAVHPVIVSSSLLLVWRAYLLSLVPYYSTPSCPREFQYPQISPFDGYRVSVGSIGRLGVLT
jgi:hypothetical protein